MKFKSVINKNPQRLKLRILSTVFPCDTGISVNRKGFEPLTHSLEGCCSIQLSYRSIM